MSENKSHIIRRQVNEFSPQVLSTMEFGRSTSAIAKPKEREGRAVKIIQRVNEVK